MPGSYAYEQRDPFSPPGGLLHLKASIGWSILPELLFFSAIATAVVLISQHVHPLVIAPTLLTAFGTILGFVISYRTSSAYERYSEGRRLWATVHNTCRTFARLAWHHVPSHLGSGADAKDVEVTRAIIERTTMVHLCGAFCVALKHYLRGEAGIFYKDLYPLVCFLPKYALPNSTYIERSDLDSRHAPSLHRGWSSETTVYPSTPFLTTSPETETIEILTFGPGAGLVTSPPSSRFSSYSESTPGLNPLSSTSKASPSTTLHNRAQYRRLVSPVPLLPSRNPPPVSFLALVPFYGLFADLFNLIRGRARKVLPRRRKNKPIAGKISGHKSGENVPLEITILLSGWIAALQRRKVIDVPTTNGLFAAVQSLSESLTGLERILLTPIPVAYSLHLRHLVWIYLILLPSQVYASFGWVTVPATAIVTFALLGLIQIGQEIESPFGYDDNDLDLDAFARTILCELRELTAHPPSEADPGNFVFVDTNLPFACPPLYEGKSALEMTQDGTTSAELTALLKGQSLLTGEAGHDSQSPVELRRVQSLAEAAARRQSKAVY